MDDVLQRLISVYIVLKLAHTFYFCDTVDEMKTHGSKITEPKMRKEAHILTLSSMLSTLGFGLAALDWNGEEVTALIQDTIPGEDLKRAIHATQLTQVVWQVTQAAKVTVEYRTKDDTPIIRSTGKGTDFEEISLGNIPDEKLADYVDITPLVDRTKLTSLLLALRS